MQLTRFTDYSLRTLMYLALHPGRLVIISEIAKAYRVSENHLMKIVHRLAQQGYVATVRGKGGGMRLASPPEAIRIGDVVRDTEDNLHIAECFDPRRRDCPMLPGCALESALIAARESFLGTLDGYTLADLARGKRGTSGLARAAAMRPISAPARTRDEPGNAAKKKVAKKRPAVPVRSAAIKKKSVPKR